MIAPLIEQGVHAVHPGAGVEAHGVAQQAEVQVALGVELQLSGILATQPELARHVIVQQAALLFRQLSAHADVVLVPSAHVRGVGHQQVGHVESAQLVAGKGFQPRRRIFVEALQKGYGQGVLHAEQARLVVDGVALIGAVVACSIVGVGIEVGRGRIGLVDVRIVAHLGRVDEAGDGHELALHEEVGRVHQLLLLGAYQAVGHLLRVHADAAVAGHQRVGGHDGVGGHRYRVGRSLDRLVASNLRVVRPSGRCGAFVGSFLFLLLLFLLGGVQGKLLGFLLLLGHRHLAIEAHAVAVGEKQALVVVAVPVLRQDGGYFVVGIALGIQLGVGDVVVVGDAAVLRSLLVVVLKQQVQLVAVAQVGNVERGVEVGVVLVLEVATGVAIVQVEAQSGLLAGVGGKAGVNEVLAVGLVAAAAIAQVRDGRQRVGEMPFVGLAQHLRVGVGEERLRGRPSVGEDARLAGREVRAHRVVVAMHARPQRRLGV